LGEAVDAESAEDRQAGDFKGQQTGAAPEVPEQAAANVALGG